LAWRVRSFDNLALLNVDECGLTGRLKEKLEPLLQIAKLVGGHCWEAMSKCVENLKDERLREKRESLEGQLAKAVIDLINEKGTLEIRFDDIWARLSRNLDVGDDINYIDTNYIDTPFYGKLYKNFIGKRLTETLGSKTEPRREGGAVHRARIFLIEKLKKVAKKYGLPLFYDSCIPFRIRIFL